MPGRSAGRVFYGGNHEGESASEEEGREEGSGEEQVGGDQRRGAGRRRQRQPGRPRQALAEGRGNHAARQGSRRDVEQAVVRADEAWLQEGGIRQKESGRRVPPPGKRETRM